MSCGPRPIFSKAVQDMNRCAPVIPYLSGRPFFEASRLSLNAELTVLSACNTGTGEYFTGEGVMGMSRSFLLAGRKTVLMSLWSIPSLETVPLMQCFYSNLRAGAQPAAALRSAKLGFIKDPKGIGDQNQKSRGIAVDPLTKALPVDCHPFYWAAFFIIGE